MSAKIYCGDNFEADSFSDLCPVAQFRIIIQLLYVPVIVTGSVLIMAAIYFEKKLHTPHDFILFAIAVVDLIIGVVECPLHMLKLFPETGFSVGSRRWACVAILCFRIGLYSLAFDFLTLLCVDRFLKISKSIWYMKHVTRRVAVRNIAGMTAFRLGQTILLTGLNVNGCGEDDWSAMKCFEYNHIALCHQNFAWVFRALLVLEMFLSCVLCLHVSVVALRRYKTRHQSDGEYSKYAHAKYTAIFISTLMFLFLILWLPTIVGIMVSPSAIKIDNHLMYDINLLICFLNSGVNVFIYSFTRPVYRKSFKFLLTTAPWEWPALHRTTLKHSMVASAMMDSLHRRKVTW